MIEKYCQFQSKNYVAIDWKKIFSDALHEKNDTHTAIALLNSSGLVMSLETISEKSTCTLYNQNYSFSINGEQLIPISNYFLLKDGIYVYKINFFPHSNQSVKNNYLVFVNAIMNNIVVALTKILTYTQEHLSNRQHYNQKLYTLEIIKSDFADIGILQEILKNATLQTNDEIIFFLRITINILIKISKLSGARAILKNNVIHLVFHLKIFERFINN